MRLTIDMDALAEVRREQDQASIALLSPDTSPEERKRASEMLVLTPLSMLSIASRCLRVVP